jgi:hypothetical protein
MIKPTDKKLAILRVLSRHHSAGPKQLFQSVLQHLNLEEDNYDLKSFYRHLQELEDSNELISRFFNSAGVEVSDYTTTSGLTKIVYDKASRSKIVGEGLLSLEAGTIYCNKYLAPKISFLETIPKGVLEKDVVEIIFFLNGKIRVMRINYAKSTYPLRIFISRKVDLPKEAIASIEQSKSIILLALPHPDLSSYKSSEIMGHFKVEIQKDSINCKDLKSTNGTDCFVITEQEFYQKCLDFEHLTSKTFRLAESEKSEETSKNHRYAHIYITEMTQFLVRS